MNVGVGGATVTIGDGAMEGMMSRGEFEDPGGQTRVGEGTVESTIVGERFVGSDGETRVGDKPLD
jgi:hypothetical protein